MKRFKLYIVYCPVLLLALQVIANILYFVSADVYNAVAYELASVIGVNLMTALFMAAICFFFNFCRVSRAAAVAEILFALNDVLVKNDDVYNIVFQVIIGMAALSVTVLLYMKKFPRCNISIAVDYFKNVVVRKGDCGKALGDWERDQHQYLKAKYERNTYHNR